MSWFVPATFATIMKARGYARYGPVFTRPIGPKWKRWIIASGHGAEPRVSIGVFDEWARAASFHAMAAFATEHNVIRKDPSGPQSFMADLRIVASVLVDEGRIVPPPDAEAHEALATIIDDVGVRFLDRATTYLACLRYLDVFSNGLPLYLSTRLVLLRAVNAMDEFHATADADAHRGGDNDMLSAMYRNYAARLADFPLPPGPGLLTPEAPPFRTPVSPSR